MDGYPMSANPHSLLIRATSAIKRTKAGTDTGVAAKRILALQLEHPRARRMKLCSTRASDAEETLVSSRLWNGDQSFITAKLLSC
eukprot:2341061-Pleurochrysis_carterae.AAC.3